MSNKEKVKVIIDSNEESQNIKAVEIFVLHEDVETFEIKPLETGDFVIEDCVFERKTPSDFASSLMEGRLREQVERLAQHDKNGYVLIEGDMRDFSNLDHTQIPAKSLRGMVASIMGRYGVPVVFCSKPQYLADIAIRIARKSIEDPSQIQVSDSNTVKEVPFMVKFFMNFDGVGLATAEDLAYHFDSIETVLNKSIDDFKIVDGVGDKTASTIFETIHGDESPQKERKNTVVRV